MVGPGPEPHHLHWEPVSPCKLESQGAKRMMPQATRSKAEGAWAGVGGR